MRYKEFERNLAEKLDQYQVDIDTDSIILGLESRGVFALNERHHFKWLWLSLLMAVLLSIYPFYQWSSSKKSKSLVYTLADSSLVNNQDVSNADYPIYNRSNESVFLSLSEEASDKESMIPPSEAENKVDEEMDTENEKNILEGKKDLKENNAEDEYPQKGTWEVNSFEIFQSNPVFDGNKQNEYAELDLSTVEDKVHLEDPITAIFPIDAVALQLQLNTKAIVGGFEMPPIAFSPRRKPAVGCANFGNRSGVRFDIIPEVGYFRPLKRFETFGTEPSEVASLREENERPVEGLQAGLYGRVTPRATDFYLQIGVLYTRISERMDLDYSFIRTDTTTGIISVTVSQTGDTITTIYGDVFTQTEVSGTERVHYYHRMLDIPVFVGYDFYAGDFNVGLEAGVLVNLFLRSRGRILDGPRSFADLADENPFRANLGLTYMLGVNASRRLGKGRLYLALRYRHTPESFTVHEFNPRQFYNQVGLNLGYIIPLTRVGPRIL
jgi:hypothetical protein